MSVSKKRVNVTYLCTLALFVAIELVMQIVGLNSIHIGPLKMSFMTIPVAIGAALLGPVAGLVLGAEFGLFSLTMSVSPMVAFFEQQNLFSTVLLCMGMRMLMGYITGWIFKGCRKIDPTKTICYYVSALSAPVLNTIFFMGYIVLFFYNTTMVQGLVTDTGASNWFMFIVLIVGVQGLIEAGVGCVIGGTISKILSRTKLLRRK